MTSLLTPLGLTPDSARRSASVRDPGSDPRHRRPLVAVAAGGGVVAAGAPLLVCLALGVVGWFATDAGSHGEPREGLRVGALGWLTAHGSGLRVDGVAITLVPLLLTAVCAWSAWRVGLRVGDSISGHGPDAAAISDGERDWTVPVAVLGFLAGYLVVVSLTFALAASAATSPSLPRALLGAILLVGCFGAPAIATGSGRAAIWAASVPVSARVAARTCLAVVTTFLVASALTLVLALLLDWGTAANVLTQLRLGGGESVLFLAASTLVLPNAVLFSGSYLLGPGFVVGTGTVVSPTVVVLGAMPMFPLLAALPDDGPTPGWTPWLLAVPVLVAAFAAARVQHRFPTVRWEEGALRGCVGGVAAGVLTTLLSRLAGGSVGPGRMQDVGPLAGEVLVHAITAFGIGGLLGGLVMVAWHRRSLRDARSES
jgi:hypothetical protein